MGGLILLFNTTVANYRNFDSKLNLINSCYCDIAPVQGRREAERAPGQYFDPGPFGIFSSTVYF